MQQQKECEKGSWVPDKDILGSPLRYEKHRGVPRLSVRRGLSAQISPERLVRHFLLVVQVSALS